MKKTTAFLLTAGVSGTALAHDLPGTENPLQQLIHHLVSLHHAPAILLILVAGVVAYLAARRKPQ